MSEPKPQVSASPGPVEVATTLRRPDETLDDLSARVVIPNELGPGRILAERYTVLGFLGQGGMGLVLAAYDARLDRRVALKLLRQRADGSGGDAERVRLVREAQSMARLSHPNVVAVYDAGTLADGSLFIAMEYVEGETLRQWCARERRSWREILVTYVEAGRGLAAAHAAGLIHRDFKPDNVLVGKDGRARVTDFGLARVRPSESLPAPATAVLGEAPDMAVTPDELTVAGSLVGTPRYMAPELLLEGQPADVHTDVFAFCASLYEALYGQVPFNGGTLEQLMMSHATGRVNQPPAPSEVPAWVARTVLGGLSREPELRPATIEAALAELTDDPRERRRARLLAAGLVALLLLVGALGFAFLRDAGERTCARMERQLEGVWDADVNARVEQSLLATGVAYAPDTARRATALLDAYADAWVTMRTEVCESGPDGGLAALRESCLERRRSRLRALTELLASGPDAALVDQAVQAVQSLPPLDYCADVAALTAAVPPPEEPSVRARVEALDAQLDRVEALYEAGKYPEGQALGEQLMQEVEAVPYAPLHARALYVLALLREPVGDYEGAKALARRAIVAAAEGKDTRLGARAWSQLLFVLGSRQGRGEEALRLSLALEAAVLLADDPLVRADADNTLGIMDATLERYEEARERHARALQLREERLGPDHPHTTLSMTNLGRALYGLGRYEEARQVHERAVALRTDSLGPEHPTNAFSLGQLGVTLWALGRYQEAHDVLRRALALREKTVGPDDPVINGILAGLGRALWSLGRHDEAMLALARALELREQFGADPNQLASVLNSLGGLLRDLGRHDEARARHERALALQEGTLGPEHPSVAASLLGLGELELAAGEPAKALPLLERALTLAGVEDRANVQLALAEALFATQQDLPRARSLAAQAQAYWRLLGHEPNVARTTAWLAAHP